MWNSAHIATLIFGIIAFIAMVVGFVGTGLYAVNESKLKTYAATTCTVVEASVDYHLICSNDNCWNAVWKVSYNDKQGNNHTVEIDGQQKFSRDAYQDIDARPVGSTDPCWYDTKDPEKVQWKQPDTTVGKGLLIAGFSIMGVFLVLIASVWIGRMLYKNC